MTMSITFKDQLRQVGLSCALVAGVLISAAPTEAAKADTRNIIGNWNRTVVIQPVHATPDAGTAQAAFNGFRRGKIVRFALTKQAGTIIVNTKTNLLYYVLGKGRAVQYRIASARPGFEWTGRHKVSRKVKWPSWRPPVSMRKRQPDLPKFVAGGPNNPLGARAIYLGSSLYRIHGTNTPSSIGQSASSGCIRMLNADVEELYRHVKVGASVIVI